MSDRKKINLYFIDSNYFIQKFYFLLCIEKIKKILYLNRKFLLIVLIYYYCIILFFNFFILSN